MALFPKCTFLVELERGALVTGQRNRGTLTVGVPEPIPRARQLDLTFTTLAEVRYGVDTRVRKPMHEVALHFPLPAGKLDVGVSRHDFELDVPAWLPPAIETPGFVIAHAVDVRLDVDWAIDPKDTRDVPVVVPPQEAERRPLVVRVPLPAIGYAPGGEIEITLSSAVLVPGEPVVGSARLLGNQALPFHLELDLVDRATMRMAHGDTRHCSLPTVLLLPSHLFHGGQLVPFRIGRPAVSLPTQHNGFVDVDPTLLVYVDRWSPFVQPVEIPLRVLPPGSTLYGSGAPIPARHDALRQAARIFSTELQLARSHLPVFVEGPLGPVHVRVADASRGAGPALAVDLTFPDLELGSDPAARTFLEQSLRGLGPITDVRASLHHLGFVVTLPDLEAPRVVAAAALVRAHVNAIVGAISALPFRVPAAHTAWERTAIEQRAFLVPTGPALHGLVLQASLRDGQQRGIGVALRTVWNDEGPHLRADVDLRWAPLPVSPRVDLPESVRAVFPFMHNAGTSATLDGAAWTDDPRTLLPALEAFFAWVLAARGEERPDSPYR